MSQHLRSTERLASVFLVASIFISIGSFPNFLPGFQGYGGLLITAGVFLILLSLSMMGYALYAVNMVMRAEIYSSGGRGFEGDEIEIGYTICNRGLYPLLFIELLLTYPIHLRLVKGSRRALVLVPPRGCVKYAAVFEGRTGSHVIGPLKFVVRDPLGLFRSEETEIGGPVELKVLPRYIPTGYRENIALARGVGIARSRIAGGGTEFLSVREYREGDEPRRIVWRHTARWRRLIVKETEKEASAGIIYILPVDGSAFRGPYRETPFEISARIIATLAKSSSQRGDSMALIAFGRGFLDIVPPIRGVDAYRKIISSLSRIAFSPDMGRSIDEDHMKLVRAIARYVGEGSFAFLFLHPTMDPEYASSLAELVGRAVRISGGSIYAVIPTPDVYATGKKDLASRLEALRMIKGSMDIVRSSFRRGVPATSVSYRDIAKISRMIELSRTP